MGDTQVTALNDVTVDFYSGEFTAIMGPSGSGKSTMMHILAGLDSLTSGRVLIENTEITALKDADLTKLRRDSHRLHLPELQLDSHPGCEGKHPSPLGTCGAESR